MESSRKIWCTSKPSTIKTDITWIIENMHFFSISPKMQESAEFETAAKGSTRWVLKLCIQNSTESIYFMLKFLNDSYVQSTDAEFSVSVLASDDSKLCTVSSLVCHFESNATCCYTQSMPSSNILNNPKAIHNDKLTLLCEVTELGSVLKQTGIGAMKKEVKFNVPDCSVESQILNDTQFADVTIAVGEREIKTHKMFLIKRSPVFAAMFNSDMAERKQNRVVIADLDYEVVQEMLHYMYTDRVPKLKEMADRLLQAADKYCLEGLKVLCEQELYDSLSLNTAMEVLKLADMCDAKQLKEHTEKFINDNASELKDKTRGSLGTTDSEGNFFETIVLDVHNLVHQKYLRY